MSDPPKKLGSLRDRIAAFENKGASTASPAAAPIPRPKPAGGVSWKPRPRSPPPSTANVEEPDKSAGSGMSAADAKAAIGHAGSLKERMAALQGLSAFGGGPSPPPKPMTEKPKWKPPPRVISPPLEESSDVDRPKAASPALPEEEQSKVLSDTDRPAETEEAQAEPDQEEEERQRRAAIAARMARLGGARVGMAPPVFAKKPDIKKVEEDEAKREEAIPVIASPEVPAATSPSSAPSVSLDSSHAAEYFEAKDGGLLSPSPDAAVTVRSPSMPVPVVPRRAAPPRKRAAKSPSPAPANVLDQGIINESPSPLSGLDAEQHTGPTTQPGGHGDREPEMRESQIEKLLEGVHLTGDLAEESRDASVDSEAAEVTASSGTSMVVDDQAQHASVTEEERGTHVAVEMDHVALHSSSEVIHTTAQNAFASPIPAPESATEVEAEAEEDETTRRKRIAERLAKSGVNPLGSSLPIAPSPVDSTSPSLASSQTVERRHSLHRNSNDASAISASPQVSPSSAARRGSTDSIGSRLHAITTTVDEASQSLPTTSSPKLDLYRKGSVGSVGSNADRELPSRRLSQDDHRSVAGYTPSLHNEPAITTERTVLEEQANEEVRPHGTHDVVTIHPSAHEGYQVQSDAHESYHEEQLNDDIYSEAFDTDPQHAYIEDDRGEHRQHIGQSDSAASEVLEHPTQPEPRSPLVPPSRSSSLSAFVSPTASSNRQSLPPPPRAPPVVPHDEVEAQSEEYDEDKQDPSLPPPPPVRRDTRPPPAPVHSVEEVADTSEENIGFSRPVTYLEVEEPEQLEPTSYYEDDDFEESVEGREYEEDAIDVPLEPAFVVPRQEETQEDPREIYESDSDETPPPPPPRRSSGLVLVSKHRHQDVEVEAVYSTQPRLPSPPPLPDGRLRLSPYVPKVVTHVPHSAPARDHEEELKPVRSRAGSTDVHEREVLGDSDGDPIDPVFFSPHRSAEAELESLSPVSDPRDPRKVPEPQDDSAPTQEQDVEEDPELTRRRTIAERMAKLGGIRFGAPPPPPVRRPQPPTPVEEQHVEESPEPESTVHEHEQQEAQEEEDEFARKQRIAARIAGMGGMRFGMLPGAGPPQPAQRRPSLDVVPSPEHMTQVHEQEAAEPVDDDVEQVNIEESEDEASYVDVEDAPPPPVPSREGRHAPNPDALRPPVPSGIRPPVPRVSVPSVPPKARASGTETPANPAFGYPLQPPAPPAHTDPVHETQGEYVMVEEDTIEEPPPPPPRTVSLNKSRPPPRAIPQPPVPALDVSDAQWEVPAIPSVDFGGETDLSLSAQWSEDSTSYPPPPPAKNGPSQPPSQLPSDPAPGTSRAEVQLSADDLMSQWGRIGVHVHEAASVLFEKSKKTLVGDGSYLGFIIAALSQVPIAVQPLAPFETFGYLIYAQNGATVQRRVSDILPGDILVLHNAKFKGHKGLQSYHQNVGVGEPLYAIIGDYEVKKAKVRVFQANQHVGQQTVESASYRLEDLKSGSIKIFRVLES